MQQSYHDFTKIPTRTVTIALPLSLLSSVQALQGFPPIATNPLGNTTNSVAIGGYYCTETVIWLQFVCLLQHKICVAIFIFCVAIG
jgi:hypothetical protein